MIILELTHAEFGPLSDRSTRQFLKTLSKALRKAQLDEVRAIMALSALTAREYQSVYAHVEHAAQDAPLYYVKRVEAGSLHAEIAVSFFIAVILANTVGETVKEAWKSLEIHKAIVSYFSEEHPEKFTDCLQRNLDLYSETSGMFYANEIEGCRDGDIYKIKITLQTPAARIDRDHEQYFEDAVIQEAMDWIEAASDGSTGFEPPSP
jgi:hypothetical protein